MQTKGYVLSNRKLSSLDERLVQVKTVEQLPPEGCFLVVFDFDDPKKRSCTHPSPLKIERCSVR